MTNPLEVVSRNLPNSLETGDTAALSPILDIASKYSFAARVIAGKSSHNVWFCHFDLPFSYSFH